MAEYYEKSQMIQDTLKEAFEEILSSSNTDLTRITIKTNLKCGLPTKDIHKIAGPLIDQWVVERLEDIASNPDNTYGISNVQSKGSSSLEDIRISMKVNGVNQEILIDVKSASLDKGNNAGKGSNLTSFRKIRPFYESNPDAIFLILSVKHQTYLQSGIIEGLELKNINLFDLKLVHSDELKFNTSMGDQFQISNSMNVTQVDRSSDQFIDLIDEKYLEKYDSNKHQAVLKKISEARDFANSLSELINVFKQSNNPLTKRQIKELTKIEDKILDKLIKKLRDLEYIELRNRTSYSLINPENDTDIDLFQY